MNLSGTEAARGKSALRAKTHLCEGLREPGMFEEMEHVQQGQGTENKISYSENSPVQRESKGGNISRHPGRAERADTNCPKD